jgi:hypothetical protein
LDHSFESAAWFQVISYQVISWGFKVCFQMHLAPLQRGNNVRMEELRWGSAG